MPKIARGKLSGLSISRFVRDEPDSVWFHHDILFCLESDYILFVLFIRYRKIESNVLEFWFQHITCDFLSSCIVLSIDNL